MDLERIFVGTTLAIARSSDRITPPPNRDREALEAAVAASMQSILELLDDNAAPAIDDEAMIRLGASSDYFVEPLNRHEVQVLASALYREKSGEHLTYLDVLKLTDRFSGRSMNITMIYKTIERLVERGMLTEVFDDTAPSSKSRAYAIHGFGREAFRLAVLNSRLLAGSLSPAAA